MVMNQAIAFQWGTFSITVYAKKKSALDHSSEENAARNNVCIELIRGHRT